MIKTRSLTNCYLCEANGATLYEGLTDNLYGVAGEWNIAKCPNEECGLIWLNPMPEAGDIPSLYKKYYTHQMDKSLPNFIAYLYERIREGILASSFGYNEATRSIFWRILGRTLVYIPFVKERIGGTAMWLGASKRGRLLDVGCGNGKLLQRMNQLGWDVVGIEPDNDAAEAVRSKYRIDVRGCCLEEAKFPNVSFDVVSMHHVIEHLPDPLRTLRECRRILRKNGHLVLVTPNVTSSGSKRYRQDWYHLDPPRHLYLFTPTSIERAVRDAGFIIESTKSVVSRGASVWVNSDSIRNKRLREKTCRNHVVFLERQSEKVTRWLKYIVYLFWQSCVHCANPNSGEEILVVAQKP